ncbi:MAG: CPCC family cysteine-rich protein [Desulfosporosinus sp.]|nr:CPCC family cysteine-rich protein [Desulfosporosinus sp.]
MRELDLVCIAILALEREILMKVFRNTVRPKEIGEKYPCPCCGTKILDERGADEICPICFWQDDGQDDHDAEDVRGGPNGVWSLTQARKNFKLYGAYDLRFAPKS